MSDKIKILKQNLKKTIWFDEESHIYPYLFEERGNYKGKSKLLVKPNNTAEVSQILDLCYKNRISVVPQGGRTGLSGGTIPNSENNEIIISMEKMNKILSVDRTGFNMVAESGCTLNDLKNSAERNGLFFPLMLPSKESCTIGGNISTNAGGSSVLKYGMTRDLVLGLEIVLPNGKILNGLREIKKDNRGYDLKHIFIGSEGTLGIITSAVLKIFPKPKKKTITMVALKDIKKVLEFFNFVNSSHHENLTAFELNSNLGLKFIKNIFNEIPIPFSNKYPWYIIIELSSFDNIDLEKKIELLLEEAIKKEIIIDAIRPQNISQYENIWKTREFISYAQKKDSPSIKHDISLPISKIPKFIEEAEISIKKILASANILIFGHIADGNIHYNVSDKKVINKNNIDFYSKKINSVVFDLVYKYNGSFSAEHGIGKMKINELIKYTSTEEITVKKQIKKLFDPRGIMNPGKVFN